ncbi:Uncharacterised protein [Mycobacteroides abscessus subsp. abscessus]|nr:Uncharacterised protein [Mycobacteroides abscessus subsp. abscessus]SIL51235.1 Uncharacterised protein [Mycobacteroides abscessus subsp. abscessus]
MCRERAAADHAQGRRLEQQRRHGFDAQPGAPARAAPPHHPGQLFGPQSMPGVQLAQNLQEQLAVMRRRRGPQ